MPRFSSVGGGALRGIVCLVVTILLAPSAAQAADDQQPKKTMPIEATVSVDWDVEGGGKRNEGSMTMKMRGTAHLAEEVSVMDPAAPPGTIITYAAKGVEVDYTYEETETQENPPRGCPAVMAEYEANGLYHRSLLAKVETRDGERHEIRGRVRGFIPLRNRRQGLTTHIGEGMTEALPVAAGGQTWRRNSDRP